MRAGYLCVVALLVAFLTASFLTAQESGRIQGAVSRDDGSVVSGVTVVVEGLDVAEVTDGEGRFDLSVPAGTHALSFTQGSKVERREGVVVNPGETTVLDLVVAWSASFAETITVRSASRQSERVVDAPAAVTVISEEEIEREASHGQVPKLLEFTPGAEVTQSGIYDFNLNTRGFNSSLNRRVATLIDGRDPSVPFLGAQEWAAMSIPLDDLASVEMIRGPSAALYGANASSGVLNMTTRAPKGSEGGIARLTVGELATTNLDLRWATALSENSYFKLNAGLRDHEDFSVSRRGAAEYARPCAPGQSGGCLPQERGLVANNGDNEIAFGALRFDHHFDSGQTLTFEGGQANIEGPLFQTGIGRVQLVEVERPWFRANWNAERWNVLAYHTAREGKRQTALSAGNNVTLDTSNSTVEVQGNWDLGSSRLVVGGSYGEDDIDTRDPRTGRQTLIFAPVTSDMQSLFAQYDWKASDKVKLVLAGRWDDHTLHDAQFSPKAALVYSINDDSSIRLTYNEAFQLANYSEFFLQADVAAPVDLSGVNALVCGAVGLDCGIGLTRILALGNDDLQLEEVKTIEIGYSGVVNDRAFLTVDYYSSENENFITDLVPQFGTPLGIINPDFASWSAPGTIPEPFKSIIEATIAGLIQGGVLPPLSNNLDGSTIIPAVSYANFGAVDTQGVDVGLNLFVDENWTWNFTASWFDFDIKRSAPGLDTILLPNSPEYQVAAGVTYTADRWDLGISGRWVDDFLWFVGPFQGPVPSYTTFDVIGNYEINDRVTLGLNVSNATDEEHWEAFGGDLLSRRALGSIAVRW